MNLLFLQDFGLSSLKGAGLSGNTFPDSGNVLTGLTIGFFLLYVVAILGAYFYFSLAFMSIGKKAKLQNPSSAWISPLVTIFETAKMHWWPFPFLMVGMLLGYLIMFGGMLSGSLITIGIFALIGGLVIGLTMIIFVIMALIWLWKTFEAVGKPGWWAIISPIIVIIGMLCIFAGILAPILALLGLILFVIAAIVFAVLVGIAAWSG